MRESVLTDGQALFQKAAPYKTRPGVDPQESQRLALAALGDLDRAGSAVSSTRGAVGTPRTLGHAFSPDLIHKGKVDLKGQIVRSAEDLAKLAQIYRDPRFETFRIFYTKDGVIVGHEGMTSRLPGSTSAFISETGEQVKEALSHLGFFNDKQEMEKWENPCCSRLVGMGGVNDFRLPQPLPLLQLIQHRHQEIGRRVL